MHWIDHHFLPDIHGTVERFVLNRHGEIDGLVLEYERDRFLFVHLPPHLTSQIAASVGQGDEVRVRGIRPRTADMVTAVAVIANDARVILDNGPDAKYERTPQPPHGKPIKIEIEIDGVVRMPVFGPKGELRGALLENGDIVRIGPKEAIAVASLLRPGSALSVRGECLDTKYGRVVSVAEIGPDRARLRSTKETVHKPKSEKQPGVSPSQHSAVRTE
jgi:hypothetical protein